MRKMELNEQCKKKPEIMIVLQHRISVERLECGLTGELIRKTNSPVKRRSQKPTGERLAIRFAIQN